VQDDREILNPTPESKNNRAMSEDCKLKIQAIQENEDYFSLVHNLPIANGNHPETHNIKNANYQIQQNPTKLRPLQRRSEILKTPDIKPHQSPTRKTQVSSTQIPNTQPNAGWTNTEKKKNSYDPSSIHLNAGSKP